MLSEDGLLLVVALVACALVTLGALELAWPTRPRHSQRRSASRDPWRRARSRNGAPPRRAASVADPIAYRARDEGASPVAAATAVQTVETPPVEALPVPPILRIVSSVTTPVEPAPSPRPRTPRPRPRLHSVPPAPTSGVSVPAPEISEISGPSPESGVPASERIVPVSASSAQAAVSVVDAPSTTPSPDESSPGPERELSVVDRGFALLESERYDEAATLGELALKARKTDSSMVPTPEASREKARLWGIVGLAKQGLGDEESARFALEEAVALAAGTERGSWERHLAALTLAAGRRLTIPADAEPLTERVATVRSAIEWLERGLAVAPDDAALRDASTAARDALWLTYAAVLKPLIERGDFAGARTILDEVMGDPELPPDHQRAFQRMLGRTMGGEAELAMAEALSHVKEGRADEALTALVRAQDLVAAIPQAALAGRRRQELERRLWSGYMKVGVHHAETGAHDHALAPLLRALSLANGDGERAGEVRLMLLRTVGAIVDARSTEIGRLIGAGETSLALLQTEKLWSLLRSAADQGLPQDDLTDASHQVLALFDRLHVKRP